MDWDYEKNISPDLIFPKSGKNVFWKCHVCFHSWEATLINRTKNVSGCPECFKNRKKKKEQEILDNRKQLLIGFDFNQKGWSLKLSKLLGISRRQAVRYVKKMELI